MPRKMLTKEQENSICRQFEGKLAITKIAHNHGCSPRTVNRVLREKGFGTKQASVSDQARGFMRVLGAYEITTPKQLGKILQERADGQGRLELTAKQELNLENVQQFLNACTAPQLAGLFYASGLIKIAEMHNGSVMNATLQHQKAAQKGNINYEPIPNYRQR